MTEIRNALFSVTEPTRENFWPSLDVYRNPGGWLVKCELAGVRRDDIHVTTQSNRLTISGFRRDWSVREGHQAWSMEISYCRFKRTIELPCDLSSAVCNINYRDGMLLIAITGC